MVFITAGMGGGTGTGAAPIVAEVPENLAFSPLLWSQDRSFRGKEALGDC